MKTVKAVSPYIYPEQLNFKDKTFNSWKSLFPNDCVEGWYPKFLHGILFRWDIFPTLCHRGEARLVFVQPVSLYFDAGISVLTHEVIPVVWDCWPCFYDKMEAWLKRHRVKTAIFTSRQEMEAMKQRCHHINMMWCPEAVDVSLYNGGKPLKERTIDFLEFGRTCFNKASFDSCNINHVATLTDGRFLFTEEQLYKAMSDAKVTICLPRSITHPDLAQGIETLTQRYWEAMLSGMVIVGHAPKELVDLIGYNPCVEVSGERLEMSGERLEVRELILDILAHIDDYQELVDRNRETALRLGDWKTRMDNIRDFLESHGYECWKQYVC